MKFLGNDYLIDNRTGRDIYRKISPLPIVDPHNHANIAEIADNAPYRDLWQFFAASDHYIWAAMRNAGAEEKFITGDAAGEDKFYRLAELLPRIAGNPVYEWLHLELKRYFGIDEILNAKSAKKIWKAASQKLASTAFLPQNLLQMLNVEVICSTDGPMDLLLEHAKVNSDLGSTIARPTWRPDIAMKIYEPDWNDKVNAIGARFELEVRSLADLMQAMRMSHDYFAKHFCVASDHDIVRPIGYEVDDKRAEAIFQRARNGEKLSWTEESDYMSYFINQVAELNSAKNWVMQMHIGVVRNPRMSLLNTFGNDAGCDLINDSFELLPGLLPFLNRFDNRLKCVLYCIDPGKLPTLGTTARAFGTQVRVGAPWWFNDTPEGIKRHLEYIATVDLLGAFPGMVSDSRRISSFGSRFEMFRRCVASTLGKMTEAGQFPADVALELAEAMCYSNPKAFFAL